MPCSVEAFARLLGHAITDQAATNQSSNAEFSPPAAHGNFVLPASRKILRGGFDLARCNQIAHNIFV